MFFVGCLVALVVLAGGLFVFVGLVVLDGWLVACSGYIWCMVGRLLFLFWLVVWLGGWLLWLFWLVCWMAWLIWLVGCFDCLGLLVVFVALVVLFAW